VLSTLQQTVVPHLLKLLEGQEKQQAAAFLVPPSKWDEGDASPSPPRKPSGSAATATINIPLPPPPKTTPSRYNYRLAFRYFFCYLSTIANSVLNSTGNP
jgi:hypothetical protein